jgi:hypothetical protein
MTAVVAVPFRKTTMKALIASLLLVAACASSGTHTGQGSPAFSLLTVHNQRTEDAIIWVTRDGYRGRRLGQVNGLATATFVLTEMDAPVAADVRFLAASFVQEKSVLSDPVIVERGATYEWKLFSGIGHEAISASYARR